MEIYIYARKQHPFTSYPAAKRPKHSKFAITNMWEKLMDLLLYDTGVNIISLISFANLGSFSKVSIPVKFIISW